MPKTNSVIQVTFYPVKNNASKIHLIYQKVQEAFLHEKRLLIVVPTFQAAQYIDSMLWRLSEESFFPHVIADTTTSEWIAITQQAEQNVNQAPRLLNLCPTALALYTYVEEIYDTYDESHPQKTELSQQKLLFYKNKGLLIKCD